MIQELRKLLGLREDEVHCFRAYQVTFAHIIEQLYLGIIIALFVGKQLGVFMRTWIFMIKMG